MSCLRFSCEHLEISIQHQAVLNTLKYLLSLSDISITHHLAHSVSLFNPSNLLMGLFPRSCCSPSPGMICRDTIYLFDISGANRAAQHMQLPSPGSFFFPHLQQTLLQRMRMMSIVPANVCPRPLLLQCSDTAWLKLVPPAASEVCAGLVFLWPPPLCTIWVNHGCCLRPFHP